jgi:hypothetical protein
MRRSKPRCIACGESAADLLVHVSIEGRLLLLCVVDAARLGRALPRTLQEAEQRLGCTGLDRRSVPDRRGQLDRRMFMRPETRRSSPGRRPDDRP